MTTKKRKPAPSADTITLSKSEITDTRERKIDIHFNAADMPVVQFHGDHWTGKIVSQVITAIPRAYRLYKLSIIRKGV